MRVLLTAFGTKSEGGVRNCSLLEGRRFLKAVVQSIPTYAMNLFRLPKSLIFEIYRLCNRFWWGSSDQGRKMHWCSWSWLCKHKTDDGLGFRDLEDFNRALLLTNVRGFSKHPIHLQLKSLRDAITKILVFWKLVRKRLTRLYGKVFVGVRRFFRRG